MIKLAIVEDELLMSNFLKNCCDYKQLGIELTDIYFNGKDALNSFKKNMPSIVVTDIKMPGMDGVELIKECLKINEKVRFIVISNYQDFCVVKNAYKMGVCDYILKTDLNVNEYTNILESIVSEIRNTSQNEMKDILTRESQLKELFWDKNHKVEDSSFYLKFSKGPIMLAVLKLLNYDYIAKEEWNFQKESIRYGMANYLREVLSKVKGGEFFFNTYDEIVMLFSCESSTDRQETISLLNKIVEFIKTNYSFQCFCVRKNIEAISDDLSAVCSELDNFVKYSFVHKKDIASAEELINEYNDKFVFYDEVKKYEKDLSSFELDKVSDNLMQICHRKLSLSSIDDFEVFMRWIYLRIKAIDSQYKINCISDEDFNINMSEKMYNAIGYLVDRIQFISQHILSEQTKRYKIESYIKKNFSKGITLKDIADEFNYDYKYFSKYFIKLIGKNFKKYLTDIRLETAKEMILTTDFKCGEIANMVGFSNYEHFSRTFKAKYNIGPNEMRNNIGF